MSPVGPISWCARNVGRTTMVQYERWSYPLLAPAAGRNVSASVQVTLVAEVKGCAGERAGSRGAPNMVQRGRLPATFVLQVS